MSRLTRDDDFYPFGFSGRYGTVSPMERPHRHHEVELFYMEKGSFSRTLGGQVHHFSQKQILLFWGAYPHQLLTVEPPGKCLIIYVPLHYFLNWEFERTFMHRIFQGDLAVIPENPASAETISLLKKRVLDGKIQKLSRATELELQSQFLYLAEIVAQNPESWASKSPRSERHSDHLSRMLTHLVQNFQSAKPLQNLGSSCRLHPNYAWTVFREGIGQTPSEYLTRYRLSYAKELLQRSDKKILDIALESGFGSVSQFYLVFQRSCGTTPSEYRRENLKK